MRSPGKASERVFERTMLPGLSETITADFHMTPDDFETLYLSFGGAEPKLTLASPAAAREREEPGPLPWL